MIEQIKYVVNGNQYIIDKDRNGELWLHKLDVFTRRVKLHYNYGSDIEAAQFAGYFALFVRCKINLQYCYES